MEHKKLMIKNFKTKEDITSIFIIKYIQLNQSRDGKEYLNIILSDASGEIEARVWSNAKMIGEKYQKGDVVECLGKMHLYQGRRQFTIAKIYSAELDEDLKLDLIAKASTDSEKMYLDLLSVVESLDDYYLKSLLRIVLEDHEIARRLKIWQAGKTIHHAYEGGLLEHILSCTNLAVFLSDFYSVNKSYVVAGAILHDLCKIYELSDGTSVDYTDEGKLVGHLVKALEIVDRFTYRIEGFPYKMKLHLKHILLAHHGSYEFGSPKIPQTKEAYLLHMIDHMDSKMATLGEIQRKDQTPGNWSSFVRHLDRVIYKDELPTFNSPIKLDEKKDISSKKKKTQGELKQNLGSLLEGFKVDS